MFKETHFRTALPVGRCLHTVKYANLFSGL